MKFYILLFSFIATCSLSVNAAKYDARLNLKKWGFAYCIGKSSDMVINKDAGMARSGYFQLGKHDDDNAYAVVKKYFDLKIVNNKSVMKDTGAKNLLMNCLDAYEDPEYETIIDEQDIYISKE